jgi:hypothetical protein
MLLSIVVPAFKEPKVVSLLLNRLRDRLRYPNSSTSGMERL